MKTKITTSRFLQNALVARIPAILCVLLLHASVIKSQTVFWTEAFNNGCASGCLPGSYTGPNGQWSLLLTGTNGTTPNKWYISCAENGNAIGSCGDSCSTQDATLHIGSDPNAFLSQFICPTGDCGAAYDAGISDGAIMSHQRATSPTINCSGKYDIFIAFKYLGTGDSGNDYATIDYFDGTTWTTLEDIIESDNSACSPQGTWTAYPAVSLPGSADNNPNVKIGFNWINDDDMYGVDPSIAIDSVTLSYQFTTAVQDRNAMDKVVTVFPNPAKAELNVSFQQEVNSSVAVRIMDTKGQEVFTDRNPQFKGFYNRNIKVERLAKGIYFLEVKTDRDVTTKRIVIE